MNALAPIIDRSKVHQLEAMMLQVNQLDLDVEHHFSQGVYARELFIPKGVLITGKIHKYSQLNILVKGRVRFTSGDEIKEVSAPFRVVAPAGSKRAILALEDSIWFTIHGTDEKDVDLIEKQFIAEDEKSYLEFVGSNQLTLPGF